MPMGGLACLCKANAPFNVKYLFSTRNFMMLELSINDILINLVDVYLPKRFGDSVFVNAK